MDSNFTSHYAERGRDSHFMGAPIGDMKLEELHAVIGFLLEKVGPEGELDIKQNAPLGGPESDPPKNEGLLEG